MKQIEHTEQCKLITFCWSDWARINYPALGEIFAVPNGAHVSDGERAKLRREGLKGGVTDLCLPEPSFNSKYPILWLEMKRPDGKGAVSHNQTEFMAKRREVGHCTAVALSAVEAVQTLMEYAYGIPLTPQMARQWINRAMSCP